MLSSESFVDSGFGPCGLGPTPSPFAAIQTRPPVFGVGAAITGYEATGTLPSRLNFFGRTNLLRLLARPASRLQSERSANTATASSPLSATVRRQPSLDTDTCVGSVPIPSGRSTDSV